MLISKSESQSKVQSMRVMISRGGSGGVQGCKGGGVCACVCEGGGRVSRF